MSPSRSLPGTFSPSHTPPSGIRFHQNSPTPAVPARRWPHLECGRPRPNHFPLVYLPYNNPLLTLLFCSRRSGGRSSCGRLLCSNFAGHLPHQLQQLLPTKVEPDPFGQWGARPSLDVTVFGHRFRVRVFCTACFCGQQQYWDLVVTVTCAYASPPINL